MGYCFNGQLYLLLYMALGTAASLGTLTLHIEADTRDFDSKILQVEKRAAEAGKRMSRYLGGGELFKGLDKPLSVNVDHESLRELNNHLDLKRKHLHQVIDEFKRNPIIAKYKVEGKDTLEDSKATLEGLKSKQVGVSVVGTGKALGEMDAIASKSLSQVARVDIEIHGERNLDRILRKMQKLQDRSVKVNVVTANYEDISAPIISAGIKKTGLVPEGSPQEQALTKLLQKANKTSGTQETQLSSGAQEMKTAVSQALRENQQSFGSQAAATIVSTIVEKTVGLALEEGFARVMLVVSNIIKDRLGFLRYIGLGGVHKQLTHAVDKNYRKTVYQEQGKIGGFRGLARDAKKVASIPAKILAAPAAQVIEGFYTGIGGAYASAFAGGSMKAFQKRTGKSVEDIGESANKGLAGRFTGTNLAEGLVSKAGTIKGAQDYLEPKVRTAVIGKVLQTADPTGQIEKTIQPIMKRYGFSLNTEPLRNADPEPITNSIKKIATALKENNIQADVGVLAKSLKELALIVKETQKEVSLTANPTQKKNKQAEAGATQAAKVAEVLEKLESTARKATVPVVANYKREVAAAAKTLGVELSNIQIDNTKKVDDTIKSIALVSGGFAGMQGQAGMRQAPLYQQILGNETKVVPFDNKDFDTSVKAQDDKVAWVRDIAGLFARNVSKGYNPASIQMAQEAAEYKMTNPGVDLQLIGHSAGGIIVKEAQAMLKEIGIEAKAIAIGSPTVRDMAFQGKGADFLSLMSEKDMLNPMTGESAVRVPGIESHSLDEYLSNKAVQAVLKTVGKVGVTPKLIDILNKIGSEFHDLDSLTAALNDHLSEMGVAATQAAQQMQDVAAITVPQPTISTRGYIETDPKQAALKTRAILLANRSKQIAPNLDPAQFGNAASAASTNKQQAVQALQELQSFDLDRSLSPQDTGELRKIISRLQSLVKRVGQDSPAENIGELEKLPLDELNKILSEGIMSFTAQPPNDYSSQQIEDFKQSLQRFTVKDLQDVGKKAGLKGTSQLNKDPLIDQLAQPENIQKVSELATEKSLLKSIKDAERKSTQALKQAKNIKGDDKIRLLGEIRASINDQIRAISESNQKIKNSDYRQELGGVKGRLEQTYRRTFNFEDSNAARANLQNAIDQQEQPKGLSAAYTEAPANFKRLVASAAQSAGVEVTEENQPELVEDDVKLLALGAKAFYDFTKNQIIVSRRTAAALKASVEDLHKYETELGEVIHEVQHAADLGFEKLDPKNFGQQLIARSASIPTVEESQLSKGLLKQVQGSVNNYRRQSPNASEQELAAVRKLEAHASLKQQQTRERIGELKKNYSGQKLSRENQTGVKNDWFDVMLARFKKFAEGLKLALDSVAKSFFGISKAANGLTVAGGGTLEKLFESIIKPIRSFTDRLKPTIQQLAALFELVKMPGAAEYIVGDTIQKQPILKRALTKSEELYTQVNRKINNTVDPGQDLPEGVSLTQNNLLNKNRTYSFDSKTGKKVNVQLSNKKNDSNVAFTIDGRTENVGEKIDQKEKDAIALKVLRIIKHDAKTRKDGYRYETNAINTDNYGAARAEAYEKLGGFSRPVGGEVGNKQFAKIQQNKITPDLSRLNQEEANLKIPQQAISQKIEQLRETAKQQRQAAKEGAKKKRDETAGVGLALPAATQTQLKKILKPFHSFVTRLSGYADELSDIFEKLGIVFDAFVSTVLEKSSFLKGISTKAEELYSSVDRKLNKTIDPSENLPSGVGVRENRLIPKHRSYNFETKSGRKVDVQFSNRKDHSNVSFDIDGGLSNKGEVSQKEKDAIALKVLRIIKHDAKTRKDGYKYSAEAFTADNYGAARSEAYERIGGLTRPVGGNPGGQQFGVVRDGKIVPDVETLKNKESKLSLSQEKIQSNKEKTKELAFSQKGTNRVKPTGLAVSRVASTARTDSVLEGFFKLLDKLESETTKYTSSNFKQTKYSEAAEQIRNKIQVSGQSTSPNQALDDTEFMTYVSGGFAGGKGYNPTVYQAVEKMLGQKHLVTPIFNTDYDSEASAFEDPAKAATSTLKKIGGGAKMGVLPTSVDMAEVAYANHLRNPEKKVRFVGHSGGAHVASEALEIFKKLAPSADARAVGIGGAPVNHKATNLTSKEYANLLKDDDRLLRLIASLTGLNNQYQKVIAASNKQRIKQSGAAHTATAYAADAGFSETIRQFLESTEDELEQLSLLTGESKSVFSDLQENINQAFGRIAQSGTDFVQSFTQEFGSLESLNPQQIEELVKQVQITAAKKTAQAAIAETATGAKAILSGGQQLAEASKTPQAEAANTVGTVVQQQASKAAEAAQKSVELATASIASSIATSSHTLAQKAQQAQSPRLKAVYQALSQNVAQVQGIAEKTGQSIEQVVANIAKAAEEGIDNAVDVAIDDYGSLVGNLQSKGEGAKSGVDNLVDVGQTFVNNPKEGIAKAKDLAKDFALDKLKQKFPILDQLATKFGFVKEAALAAFGLFVGGAMLSSIIGFFQKVGFEAIAVAVRFENLERIIKFTSGSIAEAADNIAFVKDLSSKFNLNPEKAMSGFAQMSAAALETPLQGEGVKQVQSAVSQASAVYNLAPESQERVFVALNQMISKGTVSSEELRQQLGESLPGALNIAARSMGVTTAEFNKMLEQGQVLSEDFLPRFAAQLSAETADGVAGAANSAQAKMNKFTNSIVEAQATLGKGLVWIQTLGLDVFSGALQGLIKILPIVAHMVGATLFAAILKIGLSFVALAQNPMVRAAGWKALTLGVQGLTAGLKKALPAIADYAKAFLIFTAITEAYKMFKAATADGGGESRTYADKLTSGLDKYRKALAEARGETQAFQKQSRPETLLDATFLGGLMPKEISEDDSFLKKAGFYAGKGLSTGLLSEDKIDSMSKSIPGRIALQWGVGGITGFQKGNGLTTFEEKKFSDQQNATGDLRQGANQTVSDTITALGGKELKQLQEYDKQIKDIQIKRRGVVETRPGDKNALRELKEQEAQILKNRDIAQKPIAALQTQNQVTVDALKAEIEKYENLASEPGKNQAYYKETLGGLKGDLEAAYKFQEKLNQAVGESVNAFALLQRQLQGVADRMADANDRIQIVSSNAKTDLYDNQNLTSGQREAGQQRIDKFTLTEQLANKQSALRQYTGLLEDAGSQKILESRGITDINSVGQAELTTLASKTKEGTPEKEVLTRLQDVQRLKIETADLTAQLAQSESVARDRIREANKQIGDYFRDIGRQSAELALTTKEAQAQIALQQQKNKLKSALQGFQDNFFSSFVDSLIEGMDSLNEPLSASIEKEREIQQANFSAQDRNRQTSDLYKSLPLDTPELKIDFAAIDTPALKQLQTSLQESAKASKSVTDASKQTGAAISDSAGNAKNLQGAVQDVGNETEGVKSATENVGSALQDTTSKAQDVNSQLQTNKDTIDTNRVATEEVGAAIDSQVAKTGEAITATANSEAATKLLQQAWAYVTTGVADTAAKTWEWFQGLGKNIPFLNQFGEMIAGWGKNIQDLIGKTWEWLQGLGKNIPFLHQIGQTISGWGQNLQQLGQQAAEVAGNVIDQGGSMVGQAIDNVKGFFGGGGKVTEKYRTGTLAAQEYGANRDGGSRKHAGQDIDVSGNQEAQTFIGGIVTRVVNAQNGKGYGSYVDVFNKQLGVVERIAEVMHLNVKVGQEVKAGQAVGRGESRTGVFHYEIRKPVNAQGQGGFGYEGTQDPIKYYEKLGIAKREGQQIKILKGMNAGQTLNAKEHGLGDGHNHFGEDDIKQANQKVAATARTGTRGVASATQGMLASMGGGKAAPVATAIPAQASGARGRFTMALPTGGNLRSGANQNTPSWMPKMSWNQHKQFIVNQAMQAGVNDPAQIKYMLATAQHETGKGHYMREGGSANYLSYLNNKLGNKGNADAVAYRGAGYSQLTGKSNFAKWSPIVSKHFGQNIDLVKNPDLAAHPDISAFILTHGMKTGNITGRAIGNYVDTSKGKADFRNARRTINGISTKQLAQIDKVLADIPMSEVQQMMANAQKGGGAAMPTAQMASPQMQAQVAQVAQQQMPTLAPVPFASMSGGSGVQSYSSTSVDTKPLQAAQSKSDEMRRVQEKNALDKERARVEQSKVDGEQRQRQRLEQLRQSLRETEGDRVQSNRQFRDLGLDIGEQTPEREAQRRKIGVGDTYDDLEKDVQEKIRKATAGREQASATLKKLSSGEFTPQPGQNVAKDIEAAKSAISTADKYLGDLKKIQGELKTQRESRIRFEEEQSAREAKLRKQQEAFATEEINISVLEAEAERLKGMQGRGIRDQGVEDLPKLEATIAARREEASLKQKLAEIDENARKSGTDPKVVGEQKKGLQERLEIVKKTIAENQKYAEQIASRENAKIDRENRNAQIQQEVELQKQLLSKLEQIAQVNPNAEGVDQIPKLREEIALKELDLKLTNDIAALDEERFGNKINSGQYNERLAAIQKTNAAEKENLALQRQQAETQASIARKRETFEFKSQGAELQGQVSEALAKNIELGRSKGDPTAMRFATQKQQQELSFERQMLELDELESSGKRTKEEIDGLRKAYTQLNEISLENLRAEQQRATEDRFMEISGRFSQSRGAVLSGKADVLSGMGLDTQAKEFRKAGAIADQGQSYAQQSLELERFIQQMGLSSEKALELRANLSEVNNLNLQKISQEFSVMGELMNGVQSSFESAFTSILDGSKSIGEAALDFIKSIGSQLASMASKMITDQLFGKIMGKGNEKDAAKEAGLISKGGILGQMTGGAENPLGQYSMMNPLPVTMTNVGALGGMGAGAGLGDWGGFGIGDKGSGSILDTLWDSGNPLAVNIAKADEGVFSSLTNGIMGMFGGGGAAGGGIGSLVNGVMGLFGGGGGGASGGGGMGGLLGFGMNMLMGGFAKGGMIGDPAHIQAYASGGSVGGCGCSACRYARGGMVQGGHSELNAKVADGLKRESAMTGKRSRLIIASEGEFIVPNKVASRLTQNEQNYLLGKAPATGSLPSYARGGFIGDAAGSNISSNVTNLGGSTSIGGATVNVNGDSGGQMTPQEAKAMQAMIDSRVMEVVSRQKRARGLLAR